MPFFYIQWRKEKSNITFFKMKISKRLVISSFCFPFSLKQVKLETIQSVWRTGIHSSDHYCCLFEGKFFKNLLFRKKALGCLPPKTENTVPVLERLSWLTGSHRLSLHFRQDSSDGLPPVGQKGMTLVIWRWEFY